MSRDDAVAAVDAYAAAEYARGQADGVAAVQPTVDGLNGTVASQAETIAQDGRMISDLQSQVYALTPATLMALKPFTDKNKSGLWSPAGLVPVGKTEFSLPPKTSQMGTQTGATNQLVLIRTGGMATATAVKNLEVAGFKLTGTDQGHLYNGLMVGYSDSAHVHDIVISAIPGNSSSPPGETFGGDFWHANNILIERVLITGDGVGASLFGLNRLANATVRDCQAHGAVYGFGFTGDSLTGVVDIADCDFSGNRRAMNFEHCTMTELRITRCDLRGSQRPPLTVNTNVGSSPVVITDPIVDSWPLPVGVSSKLYGGKPQTQKVSDVHLIVGGVDVTHDPKYLLCGDVW